MPKWVLCCPACGKHFTYSEVALANNNLQGAVLVRKGEKLDLPETGATVKCLNCGTASTYKRDQLVYRTN